MTVTPARGDDRIMVADTALDGLQADFNAFLAAAGPIEATLQHLPPTSERTEADRTELERLRANIRAARAMFLNQHARAIYRAATMSACGPLRVGALIECVDRLLPGLLPPAVNLAAERECAQRDKEGLEIDLAQVLGAVLADPVAGTDLCSAMRQPTARALALSATFCTEGAVTLGTVRLERRGPAALITFQNTSCLNAEDLPFLRDLETAVDLALLDPDVRVGVMRGGAMPDGKYAGRRIFCSGLNLKALAAGRIPVVDFLIARELGLIAKLRTGLAMDTGALGSGPRFEKPWIAAVDSFAIGGGMQVTLVVDHVIAEETAFFSLPAANEGIVPGTANLRLWRATGGRLARRIVLSGARIDASGPEALLVCDHVVPADGMDAAIDAAIEQLSVSAVSANRSILNLAEESPDDFRRYMASFAVVQAIRAHSDDVLTKLDARWMAAAPTR